ncbi:MAG TPA: hypothetical protein DCZ03_00050 [Gammaproteobacteria bacterium]|nr:hypothetical protein [Gammaproteobacteria bacterium]
MSKQLKKSNQTDIDKFLVHAEQTKELSRQNKQLSHILFALDATASRQATWDTASHYQAEMFEVLKETKLAVQLAYYRGHNQFFSTPWLQNSMALKQEMLRVQCLGGHTQILKVLQHAVTQHSNRSLHAVIFIGDALEEPVQPLFNLAGQLKLYNVPVFMFQEGYDPVIKQAFTQIAKLSGGAFAQFDAQSADQLKILLAAVSLYARGGKRALTQLTPQQQKHISGLIEQLKD